MQMRLGLVLLGSALMTGITTAASSSIGLPITTEVWLPGPELAAISVDDRRSPVILRIDRAKPERNGFRYTFVYTGLEAGRFDLRNLLRRTDGSTTAELPPLPVEVQSVRPPGDIAVHELTAGPMSHVGGYRRTIIALGTVWAMGLLGLVARAARKRVGTHVPATPVPPTLADRLQPLIEAAVAGTATPAQRAELERMLLTYWVRRLDLNGLEPAAVIDHLRRHEEAGSLLRQLEAWLHEPPSVNRTTDITRLLAPYQHRFADVSEVAQA